MLFGNSLDGFLVFDDGLILLLQKENYKRNGGILMLLGAIISISAAVLGVCSALIKMALDEDNGYLAEEVAKGYYDYNLH